MWLKNKKAQIVENWNSFIILTAVGLALYFFMLTVWKKMDFYINPITKLLIGAGIILVVFIWNRVMFE